MKRMIPVAGLLTAAALIFALVTVSSFAEEGAAKQMFLDQKCNMCHSVSTMDIEATTKSERMKGPDLVNLDYETEWVVMYLKKEADKDGKKHMKPVKGSDEEIEALAMWILEQKAE